MSQDEDVPARAMPGGVIQVVQPGTGDRHVVLVPGPVEPPPARPRWPAVVVSQRDGLPGHGGAAHRLEAYPATAKASSHNDPVATAPASAGRQRPAEACQSLHQGEAIAAGGGRPGRITG